ncbi:hypothetical protein ACFQWH_14760 [Mycolicibacterium sp. GCM10028919]|uniref:hypothetical protein n=1 Tax=Mycolicibacterium sp. GCM10028919 TaxID=3273401 RepID=UPI003616B285
MSWDAPDRCWQFAVGEDPPGDLPAAWALATRAVVHDLGCRRHGRSVSFRNVLWSILADRGAVSVGFALTGEADIGAYQRCLGYRLDTTAAQALVWMADDVQYELAGYEFVQWPMAGRRTLQAQIVNDQAVWVDTATGAVAAAIGSL